MLDRCAPPAKFSEATDGPSGTVASGGSLYFFSFWCKRSARDPLVLNEGSFWGQHKCCHHYFQHVSAPTRYGSWRKWVSSGGNSYGEAIREVKLHEREQLTGNPHSVQILAEDTLILSFLD